MSSTYRKKALHGGDRAFFDWHHPLVKLISIGAWQIGIINIHAAGNVSIFRAVWFTQHRDHKAPPPHSRPESSLCSPRQGATRACMPARDDTAFCLSLCVRHTHAEEAPCLVVTEEKGDPDFISHHSLFLSCWFARFFVVTCPFSRGPSA